MVTYIAFSLGVDVHFSLTAKVVEDRNDDFGGWKLNGAAQDLQDMPCQTN